MKKEYAQFAGTIPANYDQFMGPIFFEPYATDLVERIDVTKAKSVLEIACGTGRVTRHLIQRLLQGATLIATDLNAGMIAVAQQRLQYSNLQFAEANAQQLPFEDAHFDLIVCQFGFMFVPDKQKAFEEANRVLKPGGKLLFNTWASLAHNELTLAVKNVVARHFDDGAAEFYNVPFSFYDQNKIQSLLQAAGFGDIQMEVVTKEGTGVTPAEAVKGLLLGTPTFKIIADKNPGAPERLVGIAAKKIAELFGEPIVKTELNALVCEATKL